MDSPRGSLRVLGCLGDHSEETRESGCLKVLDFHTIYYFHTIIPVKEEMMSLLKNVYMLIQLWLILKVIIKNQTFAFFFFSFSIGLARK